MDTYKEMYLRLFNRVSDVIYALQSIQAETEEIFLSEAPEQSPSLETANKKTIS